MMMRVPSCGLGSAWWAEVWRGEDSATARVLARVDLDFLDARVLECTYYLR